MKARQSGTQGERRFFKGIQLAGAVCLASGSPSDADRIAPAVAYTHRLATSTCRGASLCLPMWRCAGVRRSHSLAINRGWASSEKNYSCSFTSGAQASAASSHILPDVFHFNRPRFSPPASLLISPIPFSSQVHLAFIQKFNSALKRLGLYLKPCH